MRTLLLIVLVLVVACYRSKSELVIPPAPDIKIDMPIRDTLFVVRSASYEVMAWRRDDLPAKSVLDAAAQGYERRFGVAAPRIVVFVGDSVPAGGEPPLALDTVDVDQRDVSAGFVNPRLLTGEMLRVWVQGSDSARVHGGP